MQKHVYANHGVFYGDCEAANLIATQGLTAGAVTAAGTVTAGGVTVGGVSVVEPAGVVKMYGGAAAPAGYLLCDGTAVSRTTYAALFAVIGTSYGVGDGSTTFNVPSMSGAFPRQGAPGATGGSATHDHTFTATPHSHGMANHAHPLSNNGQALVTVGGGSVGIFLVNGAYTDNEKTTSSMTTAASSTARSNAASLAGNTDQASAGTTNNTTTAGTTDNASTLPPYVSFRFIIKT